MGMIRNHLKQIKVENPAEYRRLMEGFETETDLVRDICGLPIKAISAYYLGGKKPKRKGKILGGTRNDKTRISKRMLRIPK